MPPFDFRDPKSRRMRSYETHALTAELFAAAASDKTAANAWRVVADSWRDLAALRQRAAQTDALVRRLLSELEERAALPEAQAPGGNRR
jgi:hypothetical protein